MTEKKEEPILRFEEGMKQFRKGISCFEEFAVDMFFGEEHIGYIRANGEITTLGSVTEESPSTIMYYSNTLTFGQWMEIGTTAMHFMNKCVRRVLKFETVFGKLEELARKSFSEDAPFGHIEIAKIGTDHIVIAGGIGQCDTYSPGIYTYDDALYQGEVVKVGYRPVEEQRVMGVNNLGDDMLLELVKVASSMDTFEG